MPAQTKESNVLDLQPISFSEACEFIKRHHRHHLPPVGHKFSIAVNNGTAVVGVVTVGRPVARHYDNGYTLEVTRCCTDGTPNATSMLYGAAWRAAKALGYKRLITYTLPAEGGASLRASGWKNLGLSTGGNWNREGRPRVERTEKKTLWEAA